MSQAMCSKVVASMLAAVAGAALVGGCNDLTGADDLQVDPDPFGTGHGDPLSPEGVAIHEISLYQGVERRLALAGVATPSKTPVVAGRDAMMRVFVSADEKAIGTEVTARLFLGDAKPVSRTMRIEGPSTDAALGSTFDFPIDGADLREGTTYRVELDGVAAISPARFFPLSGRRAQMPVEIDGGVLHVLVVPIRYDIDGSGRMPDTSPEAIAAYERAFLRYYPVGRVDVQVREPWSWSKKAIAPADQTSWHDLLDDFAQLRADDAPPDDLYYFGAFEPAPTHDDFCLGACIEGLGFVVAEADHAADRAAVGLGYLEDIGRVAPHEVGHEHGRQHAPCGPVADPDPKFPYAEGGIGTWGFDLLERKLVDPAEAHDLMGYCDPVWISDYTYDAFFERTREVTLLSLAHGSSSGLGIRYERARVAADGSLVPLAPVVLRRPYSHPSVAVEVESDLGTTRTQAHFAAYDHAAGGVLSWPAPTASRSVRVTLGTHVVELRP